MSAKDRTRKQYPPPPWVDAIKKVGLPGKPLNIWAVMSGQLGWSGHGRRGCRLTPKRRWLGHKITVWMTDPVSKRKIRMGHVRY